MSQNKFLSFLVDETFKLQKKGDSKLVGLELKLMDYGLAYIKGEFIPQLQILRFNTNLGYIDVPINWSVFSSKFSHEGSILVDQINDKDHLLNIFKKILGEQITKILITNSDGFCYLVGINLQEETHLHDLLNPTNLLEASG